MLRSAGQDEITASPAWGFYTAHRNWISIVAAGLPVWDWPNPLLTFSLALRLH